MSLFDLDDGGDLSKYDATGKGELCPKCGSCAYGLIIQTQGPHYARRECIDCGRFLKWERSPTSGDPE